MTYPKVLGELETLKACLKGQNIARFGNGEIVLAQGGDCSSQVGSPRLKATLRAILARPPANLLTCIPNIAGPVPSPKESYWAKYRAPQVTELYRAGVVYGSAFISRPDSSPEPFTAEHFELIESLWRGRRVLLVTGTEHSLRVDDLVGVAHLGRIVVVAENAALEVDMYLNQILKFQVEIVLLCCGALATVLAHDLALRGIWAVDLGHVGLFLRKWRNGQPLVRLESDKY